MKIGLFFGTFNPIHTGHLIIANYFVEFTDVDRLWFIISPQNPFKNKAALADEKQRLYMANLAVENNYKLKASNIEFHLPQPSYTINTLVYLKEKYPGEKFILLMGSDNLESLHKWKNYEVIVKEHPVYVYKRAGFENIPAQVSNADIKIFNVPLLNISATFIRQSIKEGKNMQYFLPETVWKHIQDISLYRK